MRIQSLFAVMLILAGSIGCARKASAPHPGAVSNLDSYSYDILITEQAVLNQAKAEYAGGQIPPSVKSFLNAAINQYNVAQSSWQTYHAGGQNADALQQAINALVGAVASLQKEMGKPGPGPLSCLSPCTYDFTVAVNDPLAINPLKRYYQYQWKIGGAQ